MPGQIQGATLNQGHVGFGRMGSFDPLYDMEADTRWNPAYFFCYQRRGPMTWKDKYNFVSLWPSFGLMGDGAGTGQYTPSGLGDQNYGQFEPSSCDGDGTQSMNYLLGVCKDASNAVVGNAIVQGFVTATDAFAGQVAANTDGTYTLGVQQLKTTQHYLVAYKAGSPDIFGSTVNTLLPTNVDGT